MKDQLQDLWTAAVLKNVELPAVEPNHIESLTQCLKKRRARWVMPSGLVATAGTAALAVVFLHPTPSIAAPTLNQVDQAVLAMKSFTVTHQVGSGGAYFYTVTETRDGDRWNSSYGLPNGKFFLQIIMDGHQTTSIRRINKRVEVLIDGPIKVPKKLWQLPTPENFLAAPSEIFRAQSGKITVKRGVSWKGKVVDEFESTTTIQRDVWKADTRHILYADPTTHLPLQLETTSVPGSKQGISEIFTYDYTPIPDSAFAAIIPKGAKVTDVREERRAVHNALTKDGLVVVDDKVTTGVFLPDRPEVLRAAKANKIRVRIDGGPASYTWPQPVLISADGLPDTKSPWRQMVIYVQPPVANLPSLRQKKTVIVLVNGKPFTMKVKRIADTQEEFQFYWSYRAN